MNKVILISLCLMALASRCKKNEPKDHLVGSWGVLTYKQDNIDKTSDFNLTFQGYKITFDAKGNYNEFYRNIFGVETIINGTWTLESNDLKIILVDNNPNSTNKIRTFNVLQPITETVLDVGEGNKEYDLRKL